MDLVTMLVIREDAAHEAGVQELVQGLAGEPGEHEAVPHTGGRGGQDGGHCEHGDREKHHDHSLSLVIGQNIVEDASEVIYTLLKGLEIDSDLASKQKCQHT